MAVLVTYLTFIMLINLSCGSASGLIGHRLESPTISLGNSLNTEKVCTDNGLYSVSEELG